MPYGKVLIVDDVESNLYVAKGLLTPYELTVDTVISGFAAIDKIRAGEIYDIIFMDHMMPHMDGVETTHKLRAMGYRGVIVALTANALTGNREMFIENGFDEFISKPIDITFLNSILNMFIRDRHPKEAKKYSAEMMDSSKNKTKEITPNLIKAFLRDAENAVATLTNLDIDKDDLKSFITTVHSMKSALANINEYSKSSFAQAMETAGRNNDKDYIRRHINDFKKILNELIDNLKSDISEDSDDSDIQEDLTLLKKHLMIMLEACEEYEDSIVYKNLDILNDKQWKKSTLDEFEKIRNLLFLESDFDAAALLIKKLCQNKLFCMF